jgi:hypothetical protein
VASNWANDIMQKAKSIFGSDVSPEGVIFDERFPFIVVLPVSFANHKVVDVT